MSLPADPLTTYLDDAAREVMRRNDRIDPAVERISDAHLKMLLRMNARIAALQAESQGLQSFVVALLADEYGLQQGDQVQDDGTIVRTAGA